MKCTFLAILFTIVLINVSGQIKVNDLVQVSPKLTFNQPKIKFTDKITYSGVHYLPQDNMPCLVPDVRVVAKIAGPRLEGMVSTIPNPFRRVSTFPQIKPTNLMLIPDLQN